MNFPEWTYAEVKENIPALYAGSEVNFAPAGDPECDVSVARNIGGSYDVEIVRAAPRIGAPPEVYFRGRQQFHSTAEVIGAVGSLCLR